MGMQGTGLTSQNPRFRFFLLILGSIIAFGVIFYWRHQTLKQSEFVSLPGRHNSALQAELKSPNYQIEVQDASPSVK